MFIMDSIEDINQILTTLSSTSNEDYICIFNECHEKLFDNLMTNDIERNCKILEMLQKYCEILQECNLSTRRLMYLSLIAPRLSSFTSKIIAEIDLVLSKHHQFETLTNVTEALLQIIRTLEPFNLLLKKMELDCQPALEENVDFVLHFGSILLTTFQHCQNYQSVYSDLSSSINQHISTVFKICHEIHNNYVRFVQSLVVHTEDAEDIGRLMKVTNKLFLIGVAVSNLDLKTMALLWKGFLDLLKSYAVYLRSKFDLSPIVEFFYNEVTEKTKSLYESTDTSHKNITLKILSFLIKIIVKLCSYWNENLEKCASSLLQLIFFLLDHSIACSKYSKLNMELVEEIDISLLADVDSLICVLINDRSFVRYYLSRNTWETVDGQNETVALLLLCTILQKLVSSPDEVRDMWIQYSILDVSFGLISGFHKRLEYEVKISSNFLGSAMLPREIFLYDALLVNMSSFIISDVSGELFESLEVMMISYFLRVPLLVKILISDMWCIIDRYGDSELCLKHITYLLSVQKELQPGKTEAFILSSLIKRLSKFLSLKHQTEFLEMVDSSLLLIDPQRTMTSRHVIEKFVIEVKQLKQSLNKLSLEKSVRLLKLVSVMQGSDSNMDEDFNLWMKDYFLIEQWSYINDWIVNSKLEDLDYTADLIFHLCFVTSLYIVTSGPRNVLQILNHVRDFLTTCDSNIVILNVLKLFQACGPIQFGNALAGEFSIVLGSLFNTCLRSQNSIVKQYSLESFSYFCHITVHDTVIQRAIGSDSKLKESMTLYLQKKLPKSDKNRKFENFILDSYTRESGNSYTKKTEEFVEECAPKKIKLHHSVFDKISEAEIVLQDLTRIISSKKVLDASERSILCKVLHNVDELRKFV